MTRKDYQLIADALLASRPPMSTDLSSDAGYNRWAQWQKSCFNMADALTDNNPKFDRERFLAACGVD